MTGMATFHRPETVQEAVELLAAPGSRALSGGASLVAMMNAGLVAPEAIVSLKRIASLRECNQLEDGAIQLGAMRRHRETAEDVRLFGMLNCLRMAAGSIGNPVVRNMGTIGGSIALADPGADYPVALVALGATIELQGAANKREIPAREFFVDWYATAAEPDELVTAVTLPRLPAGVGHYRKLARVTGDFAIASVALCLSEQGQAAIAIGGCGPAPLFSEEANAIASERPGDGDALRQAGEILSKLSDPVDDVRASAAYRRLVIPRLVVEAFEAMRTQLELAA